MHPKRVRRMIYFSKVCINSAILNVLVSYCMLPMYSALMRSHFAFDKPR